MSKTKSKNISKERKNKDSKKNIEELGEYSKFTLCYKLKNGIKEFHVINIKGGKMECPKC